MTPTHSLAINGRVWTTFHHRTAANDGDDFGEILKRLDGKDVYSLLLWKLPEGKALDQTKPKRDASEYMQCAGSSERMTVEVRRVRGGRVEHYVVGRLGNGTDQGRQETIHWDSAETIVAASEVFAAAETARLFDAYYETGWVPSNYMLRPISV